MIAPLLLVYTLLAGALGIAVTSSIAYLLMLLVAAALAKRESRGSAPPAPSSAGALRIAVLIPAHNEELLLGATLDSLKAQDCPPDMFEIVVVADNCTDGTGAVGRAGGARVLERTDLDNRGKGYALNWGLTRLLAEPDPPDAFVVVDADTWVAPDYLTRMAAGLASDQDERGCGALQGYYGVLNEREGWRAALMGAASDLHNHVKPLGCQRLGLAVWLKGNGMVLTRAVVERARWSASLTEDMDYTLDLLLHHGVRVGYVPEARVLAQMPTTAGQAASQRERWERGRYRLLRRRALPVLREGVRRRDLRMCDAAFGLLVLPLAEVCALLALWGLAMLTGQLAGLLVAPFWWSLAFLISTAGLLAYVLGGLRVAESPRTTYEALLKAPAYAVWKLALYVSRFVWRTQRAQAAGAEWVRTERDPAFLSSAPRPMQEASPPESVR